MSNFSDHTCERKSRHYWTACLYVCVFRLRIELNISPGLLCCCGSVWEEKRTRVRERAAVAMVSRGWLARRILSQKEEGYLLRGLWGRWGSFKMPLSLAQQPPPPSPHSPFTAFTHSVTHSAISLSLFLSLALSFGHPLSHDSL